MRNSFLRRGPAFGPASFYREALGIVVPVMLQAVITSLISLIDNFMVAGLGDVKIVAAGVYPPYTVHVANQINFVYIVIINVVCMAGGIFLSQHRGASDSEGMRQSLRFKLMAVLLVSIFHSTICLVFPEFLIRVMLGGNSQGGAIIDEGARFLRLVTPSFIPIAIASAISSSYRDVNETATPETLSPAAALALPYALSI